MHNPTRQVQDLDRQKNKAVLKVLPVSLKAAAAALERVAAREPAEALAQPEAAAWERVLRVVVLLVQDLPEQVLPEAEALPITTVVWVQRIWEQAPEHRVPDLLWEPGLPEAPEQAQQAAVQGAWEQAVQPRVQEAAQRPHLLNQERALVLLRVLPDHRAQ